MFLTDILLILVGMLSAATVSAAVEYYRQLRRVQKEYEKAREVVEDIILSFNRQLKQEEGKLETVAYRVHSISSKSDNALSKAEEVDKQLHMLEAKLSGVVEDKSRMLARLEEVDRKLRDVVASHKTLNTKVSTIEEQAHRITAIPETKVEAVIPIKRDKVMAPLTDTEIAVLEMLAMEGSKTAPEIKERVKLSREHTARLMKKLYEEGYLERDTNKIPFRYSVKKEMEKLLKKTESETA